MFGIAWSVTTRWVCAMRVKTSSAWRRISLRRRYAPCVLGSASSDRPIDRLRSGQAERLVKYNLSSRRTCFLTPGKWTSTAVGVLRDTWGAAGAQAQSGLTEGGAPLAGRHRRRSLVILRKRTIFDATSRSPATR